MKQIYLDYNATTPIAKEVAEAMKPYLDLYFGNPSSSHSFGSTTKIAVENARKQVAGLINCDPGEIIFTSGGTESNNFALRGIAFKHRNRGNHIITSQIEHPAILEVCRYLEKHNFEITYLPVDKFGMVNPKEVEKAIRPDTLLVSIMHANNEVGTVQQIEEIGKIAKEYNVYFHTDAAQSLGKVEVDVKKSGVDLLSIAGHKIYAPKGIGALYIKKGVTIEKLIHGADHEQNMRAGTENVLEIVGLGKACEIAKRDFEKNQKHFKAMSDLLFDTIKNELPQVKLNGHPTKRLPNTVSLSFPEIEANTLLGRLEHVAASAGSACHAENIEVSQVLEAMAVPIKYAMGTIRFSTGRDLTKEDVQIAAKEIITKVRELSPTDDSSQNIASNKSTDVKLTHFTHGLGCACKIEPKILGNILQSFPEMVVDSSVLVGNETSDDAAVYKLSDDLALVQTLDFLTPVVDNPYDFGAIATANAISDVYAMGAKPINALNIVGFPVKSLSTEVLNQILQGAADKANEAGIKIVGGHSIEDNEPKFGMSVTGVIHPDKVIRNYGAKPGDALVLTKKIGTGILSTALKRGVISDAAKDELTRSMSELNKKAAEIMINYSVHACTDITGFGLLGHLHEMSSNSKCDVEISNDKVPVFDEAKDLAAAGIIPGGSKSNLASVEPYAVFKGLTDTQKLILCDAQTSGGLLIALPQEDAQKMIKEMYDSNIKNVRIVGKFTDKGAGDIFVYQ